MTILYQSQAFQQHETGAHPENPKRLRSIESELAHSNVLKRCTLGTIASADQQALTNVHTIKQIDLAAHLAAAGGGHLDPDTILSRESYAVARQAAGTAMAAVDEVLSGRHPNALCLIRPPGHHATQDRSMGFCIFNNVAVAAKHALTKHGVDRLLIVDWDVHHGNGTQDIFYETENVVFFSIHRYPFYPGSGAAAETGAGKGLGSTINLPIAFGTSQRAYLEAFRGGLEKAAAKARPDLILISAGFDAHANDPIGNLGLATDDYKTMTKLVQGVAKTYCQGRIVSCLEGGYNLSALAESVAVHLEGLVAT